MKKTDADKRKQANHAEDRTEAHCDGDGRESNTGGMSDQAPPPPADGLQSEIETPRPSDSAPPQGAAECAESIEALKGKIDSLEESLLRAKAECQNIQRRASIEKADAILYANAELMRSMLGVLDDLERSLASAEKGDDPESVLAGVKLVYANLMKSLTEHGLEPIEALHRPFNPHVHEAMMQQPSDVHPPGTVLTEVARGYTLRDRVIRPAKVIVSGATEVTNKEQRATNGKQVGRNGE